MAQALQKKVETPQSGGKTVRPFGFKDKLGYLFGDFGNDFFFTLAAAFLMVFYTDIFHINPAHVGILFAVARLWDAFADVTWGRFIDTRKATAQGKFRPWILRMSVPLVIMGILDVRKDTRYVSRFLPCLCICNIHCLGNIIFYC